MKPIKLYRTPKSGHCHRAELMLSLLKLPYETIDMDMANSAHKRPEFLKISPFGLLPAIDDDGYTLADSNAILTYLIKTYASDSYWLPEEPKAAAQVQRWMTISADNIYSGPCAARLVKVFGAPIDHANAVSKAHALLKIMDAHLDGKSWLVGSDITAADVAAYSYIAHAPEGGVDLEPYPHVRSWLSQVEAQPGFVGMVKSPIPELA